MKRFISFAAAMIMVFTTVFSSSVFAAFSDVSSDHKYLKAITTLSKLNIINGYEEDGTFRPEGEITRAEFTKIIVYTLGLSDLMTEPTEFSDVSTHWAKCNIKTAYDRKIINGFTDGTFRPDDKVTYEQALKMVVCTLGYGDMAENQGGYPTGYHSQAASLELTKSISDLSFDAPASRGAIAQLVYNALEVQMKKLSSDGMTWESTEETLLNDYLGIRKFKGEMAGVEEHVTGNCQGALLLGQMQVVDLANSANYVTMDYREYTENITDIVKLLGKEITVYYRQKRSTDEPVLVVIDDESTNNEEYVIRYDNIISISDNAIKYYEGNASKSIDLDMNNVSVRYNGKSVDKVNGTKLRNKSYTSADNEFTGVYSFTDAVKKWLDPNSEYFIYGTVVLTDRGADGEVDDIQINDYQTIVALRTPSTSDYKISDKIKTGNSLILNPDATRYSFTITKAGKQIKPNGISANDVLLYAESIDEQLYTVYATNEKVTGNITSMSLGEGTVDIDNKTYNIGAQCTSYIADKQNGKQLATGQSVTFYTDELGTLVFGEIAAEKENPYAYIINAYEEAGSEKYYITAYCPSRSTSAATNYPLKSKLVVNNKPVSAAGALSELETTALNSNKDIAAGATAPKYSQLARLEINSDGEVAKIVTVSDESGATNEDTDKIVRCKEYGEYMYSSSNFLKDNQTQFSMNSSTLIIYVPENRARDGFAKKSTSSFMASTNYKVEAYDINSSRYAGVVLMYGDSGKITKVNKATNYSVISQKPVDYYNAEEDATTQKFSVFSNSITEKEWITANETEFADITVGDVLLFGYDQNGDATEREDCILYSDIKDMLDGATTTVGDAELKYHWSLGSESTSGWVSSWSTNTKYDYRYMDEDGDVVYETPGGRKMAYSRAAMFNIAQVLADENKIYVTTGGFNGEALNNPEDYEEVSLSNVKMLRMEEDGKSISTYAEGTETQLSIEDLKGADDYGLGCSKILIIYNAYTPRMIVIYE